MEEQTAFVLVIQLITLSCICGALLVYLLCKMSRRKHTYDTQGPTLNVGATRSILITSCDTVLGLQLALHFSSLGFRVFAGFKPNAKDPNQIDSDAFKILKAKLKSCQNHLLSISLNLDASNVLKIITLPLDVTREDSLHEAVDIMRRHLPAGEHGLWALINTSGICLKGKLQEQDCLSQWDTMLKINVVGTLKTARTFLPLLQPKRGRFISLGARTNLETDSVVFNATRYAVLGISLSLIKETENSRPQFICVNTDTIPSENLFIVPKLQRRKCSRMGPDKEVVDVSKQASMYNLSVLDKVALDVFEKAVLSETPKQEYIISKPHEISNYFLSLFDKLQSRQLEKCNIAEA